MPKRSRRRATRAALLLLATPSTSANDHSKSCGSTHEKLFFQILQGLLTEGRVPPGSIVDAGANDGTEACILGRTAPERIVHAIEPLAQNVELIRTRFAALATNVHAFLGALGAEERSLKIGHRADGWPARAGDRYPPFLREFRSSRRRRRVGTRLLLNFTESLDYHAFVVDESCGAPADCCRVLVPAESIERFHGSPALDSAVNASRLYAVSALNRWDHNRHHTAEALRGSPGRK